MSDLPLVVIRPFAARGCSEVFIYARDEKNLFVRITALLDQQALNIMDARITTTDDGYRRERLPGAGARPPAHRPGQRDRRAARRCCSRPCAEPRRSSPRVSRRLPRQHRTSPSRRGSASPRTRATGAP
jgi:[protein-PII] uridylyltransferase